MKPFRHQILLVSIVLLAFTVRVVRLDSQPLWWDEGYSVFFATRDLATMLERTAIDIHPPLYYVLLQVWTTFAGKGAVAARLLSVTIGVATIPLMYALTHRLFNARVALVAALIFALAPLHVYYSQEVRMYGLVTLLGLVSLYLFVRLLAMTPGEPRTALVALAYISVTTAALYTQYYAAFIVVFEIAVWLVIPVHKSKFTIQKPQHTIRILNYELRITSHESTLHCLTAWCAIALLYLPWILYAGAKLFTYVTAKIAIEKYAPLDPITFLVQHLAAFSVGHLTAWTWLAWTSVVMIGLAVVGSVQVSKETSRQGNKSLIHSSTCLLVYLYACVPLALGYLVNLFYPFHPIHGERLLLFAAPAFYLLAALGINALWELRAALGILATMVVALISALALYDFYAVPRYPKDDYRPLIAEMQTLAQPGDLFLAIYPWQIGYLETYYTGASLSIVETPNDEWIKQPARMQHELDAYRNNRARIWLPALQTQGRILEDALAKYLRVRAFSVIDNWHGTTRLELFAFAADPPLPRAPRDLVFEDNTTLGDIGISNDPVAAGQDIVRIRYFGTMRAPTSINASFRLLDQNGNLWAQSDREIARDLQRIGLPIPLGTPPGEYTLRVSAYHTNDQSVLRVKDSTQDSASLAKIKVVAPVQPNLAALPHRAHTDLSNDIRLMGYDTSPTLRPGFPAPITLFWQTTRPLAKEYAVVLRIQDARGNIFATTQAAPAYGTYSTRQWQPGEIVRDPQTVSLRGDTPDGEYRIMVSLIETPTGARAPAREIGTVVVQGRAHYFGAPSPAHPSAAQLGDLARFVGYDVNYDQRTLRLVLYWQALATSDTSYTVFVHAVDTNEIIRAQRDQIPGAGAYPTTTWVKGEYLIEAYDLAVPHDVPPGEYFIRIGMYDAKTGRRLPALDVMNPLIGSHILLPTRIVVQ
jgi:uncharacterized membrane protein